MLVIYEYDYFEVVSCWVECFGGVVLLLVQGIGYCQGVDVGVFFQCLGSGCVYLVLGFFIEQCVGFCCVDEIVMVQVVDFMGLLGYCDFVVFGEQSWVVIFCFCQVVDLIGESQGLGEVFEFELVLQFFFVVFFDLFLVWNFVVQFVCFFIVDMGCVGVVGFVMLLLQCYGGIFFVVGNFRL